MQYFCAFVQISFVIQQQQTKQQQQQQHWVLSVLTFVMLMRGQKRRQRVQVFKHGRKISQTSNQNETLNFETY